MRAGIDRPRTEDEMIELARKWSSDDAANRHTLMNLIGKEILRHELARVPVPQLQELVEATRGTRALEVRKSLGLDVPAGKVTAPARTPRAPTEPRIATENAPRPPPPEKTAEGAFKMPKPKFVKPPPKAPAAAPRKFTHPKFGEGVLEKQEGVGDATKLTIKFATGSKTLLSRFVTEMPPSE